MPATRKPKKVLIQFAVALGVAVILGIVALVVGFSIIQGVAGQAQEAEQELLKEKEKLAAEKKRLAAEQENLNKTPKSYKVVNAVVDLQPGQPITQEMITITTTPDRPVTGTVDMLSQAVGKVVKMPIMKGEPLERNKLLDAGYISVQHGMRAITIMVDMIAGLNGALIPGSHVDILTTIKNGESSVTRTLLQNVQVVSVGDASGAPGGRGGAPAQPAAPSGLPVTLVVTPKQAETLALANSMGGFHLTLRGFADKQIDKVAGADLTELMTGVGASSSTKRDMPAKPKLPSNDGFHNVNFSPEATNLPNPAEAGMSGSRFSMKVYRGTGTETVDFQQ